MQYVNYNKLVYLIAILNTFFYINIFLSNDYQEFMFIIFKRKRRFDAT